MRLILGIFILLSFSAIGQNNKVTLRIPGGTQTDISGKLNISDTASMLANYVRGVYRNAGSDSVFVVTANGATFAFKDSIGSGVTTLSAIGATPNANGATISGTTLNLQPASASFGGAVTTGTQTFAGEKTFNGALVNNVGLGINQYYQKSTNNNYGWGFNTSELQYFIPSGARYTWNGGATLNASGTNEWVRLTSALLDVKVAQTNSLLLQLDPSGTSLGTKCYVSSTTWGFGTNSLEFQWFIRNDGRFTLNAGASGGLRPSGTDELLRVNSNGTAFYKGSDPVASAAVEIVSTSRGFLPPRMTAAQANSISSPAEGLMVYVTDTGGTPFNFTAKGWWGYDGATWQKLNN